MNFFNWINIKLVTADCAAGKGQFATQDIEIEELLAVFGGRVMTLEQFHQLPAEFQHYPYQIHESPDLLFGPTQAEDVSEGDFFNHSCMPNAGFRGSQELVALRKISSGEQITFDYATCMTSNFGDMLCICHKDGCRVYITGEDWKISQLQNRYAGHWQPYIQRKIDRFLAEENGQ